MAMEIDLSEFKAAIESAKTSLDYMLEDATSGESDALQALLESAEEVQ